MAKKDTTKTKEVVGIKKLSIHEKLFNGQQTVAPVFKVNPDETESYPYTRERDIIAEVKPVFKEQRLTYIFTTKESSIEDNKTKLTVTFTLINVDKPIETIVSDVVGTGINKEGSAAGAAAAYTMALKYWLAKLLMIEIGDSIDEPEKKKGTAKAKPADNKSEFEKSKNLIKTTRNTDGLIEFQAELKSGKFYNAEQKAELDKLIVARLTELQNG